MRLIELKGKKAPFTYCILCIVYRLKLGLNLQSNLPVTSASLPSLVILYQRVTNQCILCGGKDPYVQGYICNFNLPFFILKFQLTTPIQYLLLSENRNSFEEVHRLLNKLFSVIAQKRIKYIKHIVWGIVESWLEPLIENLGKRSSQP